MPNIHFACKSTDWVGLAADRSLLFYTVLDVAARLGLEDQLPKCVTHVTGTGSLGAQPRRWAVSLLCMWACLQAVWGHLWLSGWDQRTSILRERK